MDEQRPGRNFSVDLLPIVVEKCCQIQKIGEGLEWVTESLLEVRLVLRQKHDDRDEENSPQQVTPDVDAFVVDRKQRIEGVSVGVVVKPVA